MISIAMTIYKRTYFTDNTIKNILKSKKNPIEFIFLLDNPGEEEIENLKKFEEKRNEKDGVFKYWIQTENNKINGLRNHVPEIATQDVVLIINDDIEMSQNFDEVIEENTNGNIFNPYFLIPQYGDTQFNPNNIAGHCFAVKRSDLSKILPIDERIKLRFGDDWIYHKAIEEGIRIERSDLCECFHYGSKTLHNPMLLAEVSKQIAEDKENRGKILKEHNRKDKRFNL